MQLLRNSKWPTTFASDAAPVSPVARRHRDDIQGLRAVAVLLVALDHAGVGFLHGGYVGVDVFFVLSGFLITGILLAGVERNGYHAIPMYYARRARRILPAATLTLVTTGVASYVLLNFVRTRQVIHDGLWAAFFAANVHFARQGTDYFASQLPPSPVQHFWTLAVEEQFYLVWPLTLVVVLFGVRVLRPHRPVVTQRALHRLLAFAAVLASASLAWSIHDTHVSPTAAYFSTSARAWELSLGATLALAVDRLERMPAPLRVAAGWIGLGAIVAAGIAFSSSTPFPGYAALLPAVGAAVVIAAGVDPRHARLAASRALSVVPLRYIGDRSYAFYLWHWPVLVLADEHAGHTLALRAKLGLLVLAFVLSALSFALFEDPIRRAQWHIRRSLVLWPASIGALVAVAAVALHALDRTAAHVDLRQATAAPISAGGGAVLPIVRQTVQAARSGAAVPLALAPPIGQLLDDHYTVPGECAAHEGSVSSQICRFGDRSARRTLVVIGDSHAQMWLPSIQGMAVRTHWAVIPLVKSTCLPNRWVSTDAEPKAECRTWYRWALRQAQQLHPTVTLVTGSWNTSAIAADSGLVDAEVGGIRHLMLSMERYSRVVVIGDPPAEAMDPTDCLLSGHATLAQCSTSMTTQQVLLYDAIRRVAQARGGFIDTLGWFCDANLCPTVIGHTITRGDIAHLTTTYASELVRPFESAFASATKREQRVEPADAHGRATAP